VPELIEVERYRQAVDALVGRAIVEVLTPDPWYVKGGLTGDELAAAAMGQRVLGTRRIGKLLLVDTTGPTLGLRFGMTGVIEVDGERPIGELLYSSVRHEPGWVRFALELDGGGLAMVDPRRLGGVELDPDESRLGPDAATVGLAALRRALGTSSAPLKARLLDQHHLAGVGNLIADEVLWRAGLSPLRPAGSLSAAELRRLHRHLGTGIAELSERGGSHTGDLMPARRPGGVCPRDGAPLRRDAVGGRTSWWCPTHQR
jgi:formamidopyrimidine-DNA glycosylase